MLRTLSRRLVASSLLFSLGASAAPNQPNQSGASALRRDPRGIKGISPFQEAVKKGDDAFVGRDFERAIAAYREAISSEPENALGHYRAGEAELAKGELAEAEAAFETGLRFVAADAPLKAKLQFALADLRERQKNYDDASATWAEYQTLSTQQPEAHGFTASAIERKRAIFAWKKLSTDSLEVKARIDKRLEEADESLRKSSK